MIDVCLLGTGGTMPLPGRWLSVLLLRSGRDMVLFDCGEGTQITWKMRGWGFRWVGAICLSHLHADHIMGLPGLLLQLAHSERIEPVQIIGPRGTHRRIGALLSVTGYLPYPIEFVELAGGEEFSLPGGLTGACQAVDHGPPCLAFRVDLARGRPFQPERARVLGVPLPLWRLLQRGEDVAWEGGSATPDDVLGPPRPGLRVVYITDTRTTPALPSFIGPADLVVCEGMYGATEDAAKAHENGHMTFRQAAELAAEAGARQLWLTHFSPSLDRPKQFLSEARAVFPHTTVGHDGLSASLHFRDEPS
ncbi:MAG: ribonuclease Z [Chloroflexi bacterium]|nr:ribonuclease Z [Chloroflexota bacterium]